MGVAGESLRWVWFVRVSGWEWLVRVSESLCLEMQCSGPVEDEVKMITNDQLPSHQPIGHISVNTFLHTQEYCPHIS